MKLLLIGLGALFLAGCSDPKIDSSSEEAFTASTTKVREALAPEDRERFDKSLMVLAMKGINFQSMMAGEVPSKSEIQSSFHGKTANEIIAAADKVIEERKQREREQALAEIAELREKQAAAEAAKEELKKIVVFNPQIMRKEHKYLGNRPEIYVMLTNKTEHAISRVYFEGVVASPGRSVPWIKESFNFNIRGGLEPTESELYTLEPHQPAWRIDIPKDAIFTATVVRVDGADGKSLYDAEGLSERDQRRLETLLETFGTN